MFGLPRPANEPSLPSLLISLARPIALSSIILVSLDQASLEYATGQGRTAAFERRLEQEVGVIREGDLVCLIGAGKWKVAMAEPVLQGVAQTGLTRFLVLPPADHDDDEDEGELANGTAHGKEEESSDDDIEIDEVFLARSVLLPTTARRSEPRSPLSPLPLPNGHSAFPLAARPPTTTTVAGISATRVEHPVPSALLLPRPRDDEDDEARLYLRTSDLGRFGLCSGDWVTVEPAGGDDSVDRGMRLARVFSNEGVVAHSSSGSVPLSPTRDHETDPNSLN